MKINFSLKALLELKSTILDGTFDIQKQNILSNTKEIIDHKLNYIY